MQTIFEALREKDPGTLVRLRFLQSTLAYQQLAVATDRTSAAMKKLEQAWHDARDVAHRLKEVVERCNP